MSASDGANTAPSTTRSVKSPATASGAIVAPASPASEAPAPSVSVPVRRVAVSFAAATRSVLPAATDTLSATANAPFVTGESSVRVPFGAVTSIDERYFPSASVSAPSNCSNVKLS